MKAKLKVIVLMIVPAFFSAQLVSKPYEKEASSRAENRQFDVKFHNATAQDIVVSQRCIGSQIKKLFSSTPSQKERANAITLAPGQNGVLHCEHRDEVIHVKLYKGNRIKGRGYNAKVTALNSYNIKDTNRGGLYAEYVKENNQK